MYCGQCGTPNEDEAGHCVTCGAPLLITTGARTCSTCGGALGDDDRFCTTCGTQADAAQSPGTYDAADDFGELDIDDVQLDELPDWLQSMAPAPRQQPPTSQPHNQQPSPDDLPDWLRDMPSDEPAAANQPETSDLPSPPASQAPPPPSDRGGVEHQPFDQFSLVSDDDLPDWLKALSDEDGDSSATLSQPTTQPVSGHPERQSTAVANLYDVPAVSRAWLRQGRQIDQDQVIAAREEFLPLEAFAGTEAAEEPSGTHSIWDSGPIEPSADDEETRPFSVSQEEDSAGRGRLIVRLVILVLLVIVALILAFVLIQGV